MPRYNRRLDERRGLGREKEEKGSGNKGKRRKEWNEEGKGREEARK